MATRVIEIGEVDTQAIRDDHVLSQVVSGYLPLKKASGELRACCPFHQERTPSFYVNDVKQFYHCFGCGAHGDVIRFVQEIDNLDFRGAVGKLVGAIVPHVTADRIEALRERQRRIEAEDDERRIAATLAARERWLAAMPNFLTHPYLDRKGIEIHGTRLSSGNLLIPLYGADGKLQTVQEIDADGRKLFPRDGTVTGGLFMIGGSISKAEGPVLVCEGFATAATLHEATGNVVVCTFNSGNMPHVARFLAERFVDKEFMVCGDDDRGKKRNMGREKAIEASAILKCRAVFPAFPDDDVEGTDFNDMAKVYDAAAVKSLLIDGELPSGEAVPDERDIFQLLNINELEALPPPTWLIKHLIADHGLSIIYGEPGTGKSFVALDMALRLSHGMDWHGVQAKRVGVLYIAGEGARGLGKRVKGWRSHHAMDGVDAPFLLLPVAVQMLDPEQREKLLRTIDAAVERLSWDIGLVVIDTVSRAIAGQDENGQEAMSLFVEGVAAVQNHTGGAAIGVHHSGKDASRGMRGSTVLLGGCDASLRITKGDDGRVKIEVEKQKDAEEGDPIFMTMKKLTWAAGLGEEESTLVPVRSNDAEQERQPSPFTKANAYETFEIITHGWNETTPWSAGVHAKRRGRYLPGWMAERFKISEAEALSYIMGWQQRDYLKNDICDPRNKVSGLRVLKFLEPDQ